MYISTLFQIKLKTQEVIEEYMCLYYVKIIILDYVNNWTLQLSCEFLLNEIMAYICPEETSHVRLQKLEVIAPC